nr:FAD-dependent oxidoreductase [Amycolatopsis sp. TNS106]
MDVIVVGAGPTGLFLASELALRGVRVTVLERLEEPDPTIKSGSINVASAEILDRRGLLPAAEEVQRRRLAEATTFTGGRSNRTVRELTDAAGRASRRFAVLGHFAGIMFRHDLVDQDDPVLAAHTAVANGILVPQHDLELLLGEHCAVLGVEIRRGVEVRGLRSTGSGLDDDADVVVETDAGDFTAGWVVAADGGRSVIRKRLGVDFAGTGPEMVGYQAIADFEDASELRRGWNWTPRGIYTYGPVPGRVLVARFVPQPEDKNAPVTLEELQSAVRDVNGVPVTITRLRGRAYPLVRQRAPGARLPSRQGVPRRRRRARALTIQRTGPQPRPRRRGQPGLETRRDHPGPRAGGTARHLSLRTASDRRVGPGLDTGTGRADAR